ncbi:hypothetical protein AOQ84DRAFT_375264 [Glonium stellatum]|uniref:Uncharacterized protein n=1 Tax=Glonium stellatum TaxID=574774 RepID=A0A8E2F3V5_9PEZI|nr:hypothetical protein AOQ84DRAFT_375264 [Glonium stellatum]
MSGTESIAPSSSTSNDNDRETLSAQYIAHVAEFAAQSSRYFLYSGEHYQSFMRFLNSQKPPCFSGSLETTSEDFQFVYIYKLSRSQPVRASSYDVITGCEQFHEEYKSENGTNHLVFIRGFPSPKWVGVFGSSCLINPEYFRHHLDFLQTKTFYDLPGLPSHPTCVIKLRITSICARNVPIGSDALSRTRETETNVIRKYQRRLGQTGLVGESIIRRLSVHNESLFTFEQTISCWLKHSDRGYTAVIWLDVGRHLAQKEVTRWFPAGTPNGSGPDRCFPIFYDSFGAASRGSTIFSVDSRPSPRSRSGFPQEAEQYLPQNITLLVEQYGKTLDPDRMAENPYYALSELFEFAARSECQFLNMMSTLIKDDLRSFERHMEFSLSNIKYFKTLLDEHIDHINATIASTKSHTVNELSTSAAAEYGLQHQLAKYEELLEKAQRLAGLCTEGISIIASHAMLIESRKATIQAEGVTRLTLLAYYFLPLNLITSFFGMNFKENGTGKIHIWLTFAVLVPVFILSCILAYPLSPPLDWRSMLRQRRERNEVVE